MIEKTCLNLFKHYAMCAWIKAQYGNPFLCDFIDWLKYVVKKKNKRGKLE